MSRTGVAHVVLAFRDAGVAAVRLESCNHNDRLPAGTALLLQRWHGRITAVFPRDGEPSIERTYDHPTVREVRSRWWLGLDALLVGVTVIAVARYLIHGFSLGFTLRPLITGTFTAHTAKVTTAVTHD